MKSFLAIVLFFGVAYACGEEGDEIQGCVNSCVAAGVKEGGGCAAMEKLIGEMTAEQCGQSLEELESCVIECIEKAYPEYNGEGEYSDYNYGDYYGYDSKKKRHSKRREVRSVKRAHNKRAQRQYDNDDADWEAYEDIVDNVVYFSVCTHCDMAAPVGACMPDKRQHRKRQADCPTACYKEKVAAQKECSAASEFLENHGQECTPSELEDEAFGDAFEILESLGAAVECACGGDKPKRSHHKRMHKRHHH